MQVQNLVLYVEETSCCLDSSTFYSLNTRGQGHQLDSTLGADYN